MCGTAFPAFSFHKPVVPWVIVTIIGLSYVHNPGCVTEGGQQEPYAPNPA